MNKTSPTNNLEAVLAKARAEGRREAFEKCIEACDGMVKQGFRLAVEHPGDLGIRHRAEGSGFTAKTIAKMIREWIGIYAKAATDQGAPADATEGQRDKTEA